MSGRNWGLPAFTRKCCDESGSIEPALTLIPLLILVLSTLQISGGVLARTVYSYLSQANLYSHALFSNEVPSTINSLGAGESRIFAGTVAETNVGSLNSSGLLTSNHAMVGGGIILQAEENFRLPSLTPLLPNGDVFTVHSVAVGEGGESG